MKIYKDLVTKANLPEFHLNHSMHYDELRQKLIALGYKNYSDFKIICERGYDMKEVIRLNKSKIRKDPEVIEIIKHYLLTEDNFNNLENTMNYPQIKKMRAQELK